jgi:hypothetical protein
LLFVTLPRKYQRINIAIFQLKIIRLTVYKFRPRLFFCAAEDPEDLAFPLGIFFVIAKTT